MNLTIAIPTFNNEKTIKRAVESAMSQKYVNQYEILVVNNASTDSTSDTLREISDKRYESCRKCNNS